MFYLVFGTLDMRVRLGFSAGTAASFATYSWLRALICINIAKKVRVIEILGMIRLRHVYLLYRMACLGV